jgi:hypothetical protein
MHGCGRKKQHLYILQLERAIPSGVGCLTLTILNVVEPTEREVGSPLFNVVRGGNKEDLNEPSKTGQNEKTPLSLG